MQRKRNHTSSFTFFYVCCTVHFLTDLIFSLFSLHFSASRLNTLRVETHIHGQSANHNYSSILSISTIHPLIPRVFFCPLHSTSCLSSSSLRVCRCCSAVRLPILNMRTQKNKSASVVSARSFSTHSSCITYFLFFFSFSSLSRLIDHSSSIYSTACR